ncbi:DExH-box ATP-dependent RNA helicase DExH10, partial [Turnera subulata]
MRSFKINTAMEPSESLPSTKRKTPPPPDDATETDASAAEAKRPNLTPSRARTCLHEVAVPSGYAPSKDEALHGTLSNPKYTGPMAKTYPFELDPFQSVSVACLERNESVLVSAHTSAGKTAVAEYAVAMAFRDKQRVIYTSPLKALSNQKYRELHQEFSDVGLMTGDVTLSPNASCLVMTTEILRGMLYRGSEILKEVAWVIFDEIHYMKDRERGVVWEESIVFLPPVIKMVFLSATMSLRSVRRNGAPHVPKGRVRKRRNTKGTTAATRHRTPSALTRQVPPIKVLLRPMKKGGRAANGRIAKGGSSGGGSDIYRIVKMIMERKFQPVIVFSFSRRECEQHAMSMSKLDFNNQEEKDVVEQVFNNAILCLNEEDRNLPAIELMLPLLQRGIAVHHSGLLPVIKELVELLFQEGLVKALFATETFAMGLNMPAKTVVFTAVKKWDGDSHRYIGSGEYIQMSGRAGRRGKDDRGICIIMIDERMEMNTLKDMVLGKPAPLALPDIGKKVSKLEEEALMLDASGEAEVAEYHKLKLELVQLEKRMLTEILRPERVLRELKTGRLIKVREGGTDWGWGVVVNVVKKPNFARDGGYIVDTLLHCSPGPSESGSRPRPCPPQPGEKAVDPDIRPLHRRQNILLAVQELENKFPHGLPKLHPVKDMHIEDPEIVELVNEIEELERKLQAHPLHKSQDVKQIKSFHRKAEVNHEIQQLKSKMRDSQLQKFRDELKNRSRVLKRLGHIDADGVVQLKGRAACLIDTGDELLVTELMFNGTFNDLDHHQVAALASCFIPVDKSSEQINLRTELAKPFQQLQESARKIAEIQYECKLDINVDEYVESTVRPFLMDVIYCWSKLRAAAQAVGESSLENKFAAASESLRRGIMPRSIELGSSTQWHGFPCNDLPWVPHLRCAL